MPIELERVAEVLVCRPDENWSLASGYLVAADLVITALHVIRGRSLSDAYRETRIRLLKGDGTSVRADLLWEDSKADMAILRLSMLADVPLHLSKLQWGTFERKNRVNCESVGFPDAMLEIAGSELPLRESTGLFGYVDPYGGIKGGWLPFNVDETPSATELWKGISGAAAFAEGCVIGVILSAPESFKGTKLRISPIDTVVARDADFRRILSLSSYDLIEVGQFPFGVAPPSERTERSTVPKPVSAVFGSAASGLSGRDWYPIRLDISDWPVRDQGSRPTTVAFAVVACREYMEIRSGKTPTEVDLSEECLYWATKNATSDPNPPQRGTRLRYCLDALENVGVCEESEWPYNSQVAPSYSEIPNQNLLAKAAAFRHRALHYQTGGSAVDVYSILAFYSRPVAITTKVFASWYSNVWVRYTGDICLPVPGEDPIGGHAFCIVGYEPNSNELLGGHFIVRNCWGDRWATKSTVRPGYGRIPATYFDSYLLEMCVL